MQSPVGLRRCRHELFFNRAKLSSSWHTFLYNSKTNQQLATNSDKGDFFFHKALGNHRSKHQLQCWDVPYVCSTANFFWGERAVCEAGSPRKIIHWWGVCSRLSPPPEWLALALKARCRNCTAVVRKTCQVQGSDESAALGGTLLFKCSKTLHVGKTPQICN